MKIIKKDSLFAVLLIVGMVFFLSAFYAKAENSDQGNMKEGQEDVVENETEDDTDEAEDVNEIENEIEDSDEQEDVDDSAGGIKQQNKEQEREQVQNGEKEGEMIAEQRRSAVANAVQEMLQMAEKNDGIGQQVRVIAQAQNENQEKIEASLEKVQNRSNFAKFFFGPNYKEIENAEKILEQNSEQIRQLNEIKNQLVNQGDAQALTEQIQILEQANLEIKNSLENEKGRFSLFGWLFS